MGAYQVCLGCRCLTLNGSRCESCERKRESARNHSRPHYQGAYRKRAAEVRQAAQRDPSATCWLCGETVRHDDPWTADHVVPSDPSSALMPAHRSCNSARGDAKGRRGESGRMMERRA
jgi:5-methylcytosine-specific restriction endonuclease McrA